MVKLRFEPMLSDLWDWILFIPILNCVPWSRNVMKNLTSFFDVWLLTVFRLFPPFCPYAVLLDKLIRKAGCFPFGVQCKIQTMQAPALWELSLALPPNNSKSQNQSPFLAILGHFWPVWESCPTFPRDLNYVSNKTFHTLLGCVFVCVCAICPQSSSTN